MRNRVAPARDWSSAGPVLKHISAACADRRAKTAADA
jgi:hypothetical protein